jgi:hypothetical protein
MKSGKPIETLILTIRGQKVILDSDLADLYGVSTSRLNEQVKRNADRFPEDFCFRLIGKEWAALRSHFAILNTEISENKGVTTNLSQFATGSQRHRDPRLLPRAFTEHGAIMAATVLNSPEAVAMSVYVVRAFVQMREQIAANAEILKRLAEIDKTLLKHDKSLQIIWNQLQPLLAPPPTPSKRSIGFEPGKK